MAKKTKNSKAMKRRNFLKGAGAAALGAAAVSSFPAPAISCLLYTSDAADE